MALLDPLRNMYGVLTKASEEAGSLLSIADSRGLTGVMRNLMGLDPEGMSQMVKEILGAGTLDLLATGDKSAVETVLDFRKYCSGFMGEFIELRDILVKFNSDDAAVKSEAISEMKAIIAEKDRAPGRARRERALTAEMAKLSEILEQISELAAKGAEEIRSST